MNVKADLTSAREKEAMMASLGVGSATQLSYWKGHRRGLTHRAEGGVHGDRTWKDYDHQANETANPDKAALGRGFIDGFGGNFLEWEKWYPPG